MQMGEYFSNEVADWTACLREAMDTGGWSSGWQTPAGEPEVEDGLLLVHVHRCGLGCPPTADR